MVETNNYITAFRLCGYAPFYHRKQVYMLRAIAEGKYEFRSPEWDEISDAAKDLVSLFFAVERNGGFMIGCLAAGEVGVYHLHN